MKIMYDDVREIAKLAALHLSETEISTTTDDLRNILNLLNQLESFSIDESIEPLEQPFPLEPLYTQRSDEALPAEHIEHALSLAPHAEDNVYLVPKVIE